MVLIQLCINFLLLFAYEIIVSFILSLQMDSDGNILEDKISSYMKEKMAPLKYPEEVQDKIVDTCIKEAKNMTRNTDQSKETCNPIALKLGHCFYKEVS